MHRLLDWRPTFDGLSRMPFHSPERAMRLTHTAIIADRSPLAARGLKALLERRAALTVVSAAHEAEEAIGLCRYFQPDFLITDLRIESDRDGLYVMRQVRLSSRGTRVIVLSTHQSGIERAACFTAGAHAHLDKGCDPALILETVNILKNRDGLMLNQCRDPRRARS